MFSAMSAFGDDFLLKPIDTLTETFFVREPANDLTAAFENCNSLLKIVINVSATHI